MRRSVQPGQVWRCQHAEIADQYVDYKIIAVNGTEVLAQMLDPADGTKFIKILSGPPEWEFWTLLRWPSKDSRKAA